MRRILGDTPGLVDQWEGFSEDTRFSPAPYFHGNEVGDFDGKCSAVVIHDDRVDACIDYIFRRIFGRTLTSEELP